MMSNLVADTSDAENVSIHFNDVNTAHHCEIFLPGESPRSVPATVLTSLTVQRL